MGTDGKPVEAHLCGPATDPNPALGTLPKGSLTGKIVLVSRGLCSFVSKAERARARRRDRDHPRRQPLRRGERDPDPAADPGRHDLRPRRPAVARLPDRERRPGVDPRLVGHPGDPDEPQRRDHELLVGRPDRLRLRPEARHLRSRPRRALVDAAAHHRLDVLRLRRHVDGDAARRRRGRAAPAAASRLVVVAGEVGADVDRRARRGATPRAPRRRRCCSRAPASRTCSLPTTRRSSPTRSRSRSRRSTSRPARSASRCSSPLSDAGDGAGTYTVSLAPQAQTTGVSIDVPGTVVARAGRRRRDPGRRRAAADAGTGENYGFVVLHRQRRAAPRPVLVPRRAPGAARR